MKCAKWRLSGSAARHEMWEAATAASPVRHRYTSESNEIDMDKVERATTVELRGAGPASGKVHEAPQPQPETEQPQPQPEAEQLQPQPPVLAACFGPVSGLQPIGFGCVPFIPAVTQRRPYSVVLPVQAPYKYQSPRWVRG